MDYIFVGKIVNTHGIKGELRIKSDFKYKKDIFKTDLNLYIGEEKVSKKIKSYRVHKDYDMVVFDDVSSINDVLIYKGKNVYVKRDELNINGVLDEDLINMKVYSNGIFKGILTDILRSKAHDILVIENEGKKYLVPYIDEFVSNIDLKEKKIDIKEIEGLFNED